MQLIKIQLRNFRCFDQLSLDLNSPLVLIEGENGSGKTSILEALSYLCFLRSFRTHITKELIKEKSNNFFIKAQFYNPDNNEIQVGFSGKKRLVKVNGKSIQSYKDLMELYRVITLIEDDLELVKGNPETRRIFIDQHISLHNPQFIHKFKKYKQVVQNRNALLFKGNYKNDDYLLWTNLLWHNSRSIQNMRLNALDSMGKELNELIKSNFPELKASFVYESKLNLSDDFENFINLYTELPIQEQYQKRSLFGSHLDDFSIIFLDKKTKIFASRGQQKLLVLLIKIAQIKLLNNQDPNKSIIFLLDDFMTDFDSKRLRSIIPLLCSLNIQLILTSPSMESPLKSLLLERNALIVHLNY